MKYDEPLGIDFITSFIRVTSHDTPDLTFIEPHVTVDFHRGIRTSITPWSTYLVFSAREVNETHEFALIGLIRGQKLSGPTNNANKRQWDKCDLNLTTSVRSHLEN